MRLLLVASAVLALALPGAAQAQFDGKPLVTMDEDGRTLILERAFSFKDAAGKTWRVPKGTRVDGASIPKVFWSLIGGPLEGQYRNASIIHDYYCDTKLRAWKDVHRNFYEGMIVGGVAESKAKLMYFAVYKFGPRWELRKTQVLMPNFSGPPTMVEREMPVDLPTAVYDPKKVEAAVALAEQPGVTLEQLEALADAPTS